MVNWADGDRSKLATLGYQERMATVKLFSRSFHSNIKLVLPALGEEHLQVLGVLVWDCPHSFSV